MSTIQSFCIDGTQVEKKTFTWGTQITVELGSVVRPGRGSLLTESLFDVTDMLRTAAATASDAVVVDIRVPQFADPKRKAEAEAFISAVKGILQTWVLEIGAASASSNLVVSDIAQTGSRDLVIEYLVDEKGRFSTGSMIDLRKEN